MHRQLHVLVQLSSRDGLTVSCIGVVVRLCSRIIQDFYSFCCHISGLGLLDQPWWWGGPQVDSMNGSNLLLFERWLSYGDLSFALFLVSDKSVAYHTIGYSQPRNWSSWAYAYVRHFAVLALAFACFLFLVVAMTNVLFQFSVSLNSNEGNHLGFTDGACHGWMVYEAFLSISLILVVEGILLIRSTSGCSPSTDKNSLVTAVYALYDRSRRLLWILAIFFVCETLTAIVALAISISVASYSLELGCVVTSTPRLYMASWYVSGLYEDISDETDYLQDCSSNVSNIIIHLDNG